MKRFVAPRKANTIKQTTPNYKLKAVGWMCPECKQQTQNKQTFLCKCILEAPGKCLTEPYVKRLWNRTYIKVYD